MRFIMLFLPMLLFFALLPSWSFADGYLRLGGMYSMDENGSEGSTSDSSRMLIDLGAGYVTLKGWTLGVLYGMEKTKSSGNTVDRTVMGPTVGWITRRESGFYVLGTYFLSVERSDEYDGKGYQLDLGYKFSLRKISFAPQLSYRSVTYDKADGQSISPKQIEKKLEPYFVFWLDF